MSMFKCPGCAARWSSILAFRASCIPCAVPAMSSSPIDAAPPAPAAVSGAAVPPPHDIDIRQRNPIKRLLPQTMFGRSLLLIVMPLILAQIIAISVFYGRHWEIVSRRLSSDVAGDIGLLIDAMKFTDNELELARLMENASALTNIDFALERHAALPAPVPAGGSLSEQQLRFALTERVGRPYWIDAVSEPRDILIQVQLSDGVLTANVPRKRLSTSTTYVFVLWTIGSSLVLLLVAAIFLRNQVKSLRRLAAAAESFGKGRPVSFYKPEGALEVRQAAAAFIRMRARIDRQIRQRTEMLAGVSHDLRTPLTRMKLALELLGADRAAAGLKSDVVYKTRLITADIEFARGNGTEVPVETDIAELVEETAAASQRDGLAVTV